MEVEMAPLDQDRYPIYTERNPPPGARKVDDLRRRDYNGGQNQGNGGDDDDDGPNHGNGHGHGHHSDDDDDDDDDNGGHTHSNDYNQGSSGQLYQDSPAQGAAQSSLMTTSSTTTSSSTAAQITSKPSTTTASPAAAAVTAPASIVTGIGFAGIPNYTSSPGRKGVDGNTDPTSTSSVLSSAAPSSTLVPSALADNSFDDTPQGYMGNGNGNGNGHDNNNNNNGGGHHNNSNGLSSTAEHLLIAAGSIGAFILVCAIIYFLMRLFKKDPRASLNRYRQGMSRMWRKSGPPGPQEAQPNSLDFYSEEKRVPTQRRLDAFFSPNRGPEVAVPASTATIERVDSQRKALVQEALVQNPPPIELMPTSNVPLEYPPPPFYTPLAAPAYVPAPANQDTYATYNTTRRVSELSSLSSGFGDAKIDVPESGPSRPNQPRKSVATRASRRASGLGFISRFSWASTSQATPAGKDGVNRDTMYTTSSDESVPRFRSIYSWVNQQSSRLRRQEDSDRELENMPDLPRPVPESRAPNHKRLSSGTTDPAFRYHPGEEVKIKRGSRVPSEILDKTLGR